MTFLKKYWIVPLAGFIFLGIYIIENVNHRFWLNDFKVYYEATKAFSNNNAIYGVLFALGSGYYKYSPFTLLLFAPYCIFNFEAARIIHYFFLSVSSISLFCLCGHLINKYFFNCSVSNQNLLLLAAMLCTINHLVREVHLGNINVMLLLLVISSLYFLLQLQFIIAGILLALVIITKPFFILLLLPLLFRKKIKSILSVFSALIIFTIIPALFIGWSGNILLQLEWLHTLLEHNADFPSHNTIESLLKIYFNTSIPVNFQFYLLVIVFAGYLLVFFKNKSSALQHTNSESLIFSDFLMECFLLLAILPNIFKTDTEHFIYSLPLIIFLLFRFSKEKNLLQLTAFVLIIILYGGNSTDIVGKKFSLRMGDLGVLGIGNLLLILFAIYFYFKLKKDKSQDSQSKRTNSIIKY